MLTTEITATMTSVELVDVINSDRAPDAARLLHKNFIAKIERHPGIDSAKYLAQYRDDSGRMLKCYKLPKRECELLVMSESLAVQTKVYDRMVELSAAAAAPRELSRMELLELAMQTERERLALADKIAADAPKVAFAEIIRNTDAVCRIGDFCKTMKAGRNKLFARMKADKILMEDRMPYQKYIDKGYFSVIEQKPYKDSKGVSHPAFTTMVTGAGQLFLTRKYSDLTGAA